MKIKAMTARTVETADFFCVQFTEKTLESVAGIRQLFQRISNSRKSTLSTIGAVSIRIKVKPSATYVACKFSCTEYDTSMITATEAAKKIGCSTATVTRWAKFLGYSQKYGNALLLSEKQVKKISERRNKMPGNPNFKKK